jgi:adenosine deaminase
VSTTTSLRDIRALPKAHLHLHLAQAMRSGTLAEWSAEDGAVAPTPGRFPDFTEFLSASSAVTRLLTSKERVQRLIEEAVEDASLDGVPILELSFSPPLYSGVFGDPDAALQAMTGYARAAGERFGVWTGLIIGIDRHAGPGPALETAKLAARFSELGVVGLGLYGDERAYPASAFAEAFRVGKDAGILSVPHAGELLGAESIRAALTDLQADRIQHGVTAIDDSDLLDLLAASAVCLDVCPTSNVNLGVIASMREHPLPRLLEAGVHCSINADDPTLFGPGAAEEYAICRADMGLDDEALAACARSSIEASAAPRPVKDRALSGVEDWLAAGTL